MTRLRDQPCAARADVARTAMTPTPFQCMLVLILLLVLVTGVVGCGGSDDEPEAEETSAGAIPAALQSRIDALYDGVGFESPAAESPPPAKEKRVWVLSCNESVASCHDASNGAIEAARALGWGTTLFDTKFQPSRMAQGIRQAIAAGADGIVTYVMDCPLIKQPLAEARRAGVKVVTAESLQCGENVGYDHVVEYSQGDFPTWWRAYGAAGADLLISGTNGRAKVIVIDETDIPSRVYTNEGYRSELAKCRQCETVATVEFTVADVGSALQQKVQQALVQHPDANAVWMPFDIIAGGVGPALRSSGRAKELFVDVAEGQEASLNDIRSGVFKGGGDALATEWEAYASIDALNRLFAGERPLSSGIGLQIFDDSHNMPRSGRWQPPVDYKAAYKRAWGVGG